MIVLECNLDDCSPQVLGALVDTLLARGALDAWIAPVVMKKGRPGHLVGVLATPAPKDALESTRCSKSRPPWAFGKPSEPHGPRAPLGDGDDAAGAQCASSWASAASAC